MGTQSHEGIAGAAAAVDFYASLSDSTPSDGDRVSSVSASDRIGSVSTRSGSDGVKGSDLDRREALRQSFAGLRAHSAPQVARLWEALSRIAAVRLYGPPPPIDRTPTVAFTVKGVASTEVARRFAARGLFVSHGDFYAQTVVDRLDLQPEGLVRVGCACYTSDEEIERLIEGVREIAS
jgi:selenocysteine lyase/cysteine desulfurase